MQSEAEKRPKIFVLGEEVAWEEAPDANATELVDYFKPVRLSPTSVDSASKIVPSEFWIKHGIYSWLQMRANHVFSKMTASQRKGKLGQLEYSFEFGAEGPILRNVFFSP